MPVMNEVKLAQGGKWLAVPRGALARWGRSLPLMQHLLLVAVAPFLVFLLTASVALQMFGEASAPEDNVHERGLSTVRLLAPAAELGVAFRNPLNLTQLLETLLQQESVAAVAIYDGAGEVIVSGGRAGVPGRYTGPAHAGFISERDGRVSFVAPVMTAPVVLDEIAWASMANGSRPAALGSARPIGWVYLELYKEAGGEKRAPLWLLALIPALAMLASGVYLALRLAHGLGAPLMRLADAVRRLAAGEAEVSVPVEALSPEVQALQEGVNTLGRAIANVRTSMQAKIEETTGQLVYQALHDPLTGLPNRRAFDQALEEAVLASRRASDQGALCFIDLDHFKIVNDVAGHAAGDALLREVARLIQQRVRGQDLICRIGGDEFALILRGCTRDDAQRIAATLCEAIAALRFEWEGQSFRLSGSFGLTHIDDAMKNTAEVLKAADAACYAAKRQGRNQVVVDRDETRA